MQIELVNLNKNIGFDELKLLFFTASNKKIKRLCLSSGLLNIFPDKSGVELCSLVDFPFGLSSHQSKLADVLYSVRVGAKYIDVVLNHSTINDGNLSKLKHELKDLLEVCKLNKAILRPVLEYTLCQDVILRVCEEILNCEIMEVVTSTGCMANEFSDNLLVAKEIQDKIGIECTLGNACCSKEQFELVKKAKIKGVRLTSIKIYEKIFE